MRHQRRYVRQLRRLRAQKLPPRRRIEKQIRNRNRRPARHSGIVHMQNLAARNLHPRPRRLLARLVCAGRRLQRHPRHRGNRRQRLTAKSQRRNLQQVVRRAQLRSRVPLKGQQRIVAVHAVSIVGHANQLASTRLNLHANPRSPGIERIFEQFLHHRRRPVHHLARGNLVSHLIGENPYAPHKGLDYRSARMCIAQENRAHSHPPPPASHNAKMPPAGGIRIHS